MWIISSVRRPCSVQCGGLASTPRYQRGVHAHERLVLRPLSPRPLFLPPSREIEDFRKTQTRGATREFDLNDPKGLWKDQPARVGDDDPRCGPASAQRFAGEDLMAGTRRLALQQQLRAGLEAQMDHKRAVAEVRGGMAASLFFLATSFQLKKVLLGTRRRKS